MSDGAELASALGKARKAALEAKASKDGTAAALEDGWWTKWHGPDVAGMSAEEKAKVAAGVAEEIIKDEGELKKLYERKEHPCCYDGFEPSGRMHIAQGLQRAMNTNTLTSTGVKFVFWVADYFAFMNHKMDGDMKKIQDCGRYMIEVWRACGMDLTNVEFVWASEFINMYSGKYWFNVLQIALRNSISRVKRCGQIMGREESDDLSAAQIFYPIMQCNDVFMLRCDMTQLGIDQRKVNMLAREYCDYPDNGKVLSYLGKDEKGNCHKPVILSHHMLAGLKGVKMSKSDPDAAIFMEDTEAEVNRKIKKAYCPEKLLQEEVVNEKGVKETKTNGCIEYVKYLVLPKLGKFEVAFHSGGSKTYTKFEDVVTDYTDGTLHPGDLKPALAIAVNQMLQPVRDHFTNDPTARDLLKKMEQYMAERAAKAAATAKAAKKGGGGQGKAKGGGGGKAKGGGGKAKGAAPAGAPCLDTASDDVITCLDIRVGELKNVRRHPAAEKLYVEDIDIGEETPRQVCSGLVDYIPQDQMEGPCLVVCNLKSRKMQGTDSQAMVMAAQDGDKVELLKPPPGVPVGERVTFGDGPLKGDLATPNQLNKGAGKKVVEFIIGGTDLKTNGKGEATWKGEYVMHTSKGPVTVPTLANANIK